MALQCKLQLVAIADDGEQVSINDLVVLNKEHERLEQVGLTLAEAKALLLEVQHRIVTRQVAAFLAARTPCPSCGRPRGLKDHQTILFRTLFGKLELASPRLRRCPCHHNGPASTSPLVELLPEHTAPELLYLEGKWASLVSYGLTVKALGEFLPLDAALNTSSVRRDALSVGRRLEMELGPEPDFPLAGCPGECASLPPSSSADHRRDRWRLPAALAAQADSLRGDRGQIGSKGWSRQAVRLRAEPRPEAAASSGGGAQEPRPAAQPRARVPLGWRG
jgi:hypothetical protein